MILKKSFRDGYFGAPCQQPRYLKEPYSQYWMLMDFEIILLNAEWNGLVLDEFQFSPVKNQEAINTQVLMGFR